jgi:hypothetical protein
MFVLTKMKAYHNKDHSVVKTSEAGSDSRLSV